MAERTFGERGDPAASAPSIQEIMSPDPGQAEAKERYRDPPSASTAKLASQCSPI